MFLLFVIHFIYFNSVFVNSFFSHRFVQLPLLQRGNQSGSNQSYRTIRGNQIQLWLLDSSSIDLESERELVKAAVKYFCMHQNVKLFDWMDGFLSYTLDDIVNFSSYIVKTDRMWGETGVVVTWWLCCGYGGRAVIIQLLRHSNGHIFFYLFIFLISKNSIFVMSALNLLKK